MLASWKSFAFLLPGTLSCSENDENAGVQGNSAGRNVPTGFFFKNLEVVTWIEENPLLLCLRN